MSVSRQIGDRNIRLSNKLISLSVVLLLSGNNPGSRISTKQLLHEYFRWKPKYVAQQDARVYSDEFASWVLRNRGMNEYQSYIDSFKQQEPEANLPKVLIFNTCELLNQAIKSCVYDKTDPEDVAEFPGDDAYDGFRYIVDSADNFFDESTDEFTKIQQTQAIVEKLRENSDWTAYYRNLRSVEVPNRMSPVYRYSSAGKFRYGRPRIH